MDIQNLFNQFLGSQPGNSVHTAPAQKSSSFASALPGGLAGGAAAGGIVALLAGNKKARKFAGKAATYGGAAVLGGMAYKAFKNWQSNSQNTSQGPTGQFVDNQSVTAALDASPDFQLTLIKAMIAAAKSDGHIDSDEQARIFEAVEKMNLSAEQKGLVLDLLRKPVNLSELAHPGLTLEQRSEIYLASCLAITADESSEKVYLEQLAWALQLPEGLPQHIQQEVHGALGSDQVA